MTRVVGVNGINTHGANNIDLLLMDLDAWGIETVDVDLPIRTAITSRWSGKCDGDLVAAASEDGDILVAHSFGAVRAWYAHKKKDYKGIILIAPAHSKNAEWNHPSRVTCFYSPKDHIVRAGALLIGHPFGKAGVNGYTQEGVTNVKTTSDHNDYFNEKLRRSIADCVIALL